MNVVFRPRLIPTLCTIVLLPVLAALGFWQLDRAQQKTEILELYESRIHSPPTSVGATVENPEEVEYRQIRASGTWEGDYEFYVDNRILNGRPGFYVITPLLFQGGKTAVLVNRGWIPAAADRSILPNTKPVTGEVVVTGFAVIPPQDAFMLKDEPALNGDWPSVWQTLDLQRFSTGVPYSVQGFVIQLNPGHEDGFERQWNPPSNEWIFRHKAYAFQWFALCAALLVIYFLLVFRPVNKSQIS